MFDPLLFFLSLYQCLVILYHIVITIQVPKLVSTVYFIKLSHAQLQIPRTESNVNEAYVFILDICHSNVIILKDLTSN